MRNHFEVREYDGAGRLGELTVPRADRTIETPALLPVVNPHVQTLEPSRIYSELGADILITNSYIIHGSDELREPAIESGLHELLEFPGVIMTDSGSFQLSEYGDIDVTTEEILSFQYDIGADIGTPVDIPTPPDVSEDQARAELETTQERIETAAAMDLGEMLVTAPIQGSTDPDLRERAGNHARKTDLDLFPIGAVVPLMNEYRFRDLVDVVVASKRGLGEASPVHLFGAGHPMTFALAAALGCDLFDSAAYALYARDDRYLTVRGTEHLDELSYFPCECPICREHTPHQLQEMAKQSRYELLAEHNLSVSFGEIRRVRQAIRGGNLFELLESRARSHPTVLDGYRRLLEYDEYLEATDPVSKDAFFYLSGESARRPEVKRHHERLERLKTPAELLLTPGNASEAFDESWPLIPPFGPLPRELVDVYPLTAEVPTDLDRTAYESAAQGVRRLARSHPDTSITVYHDNWPDTALERLPPDIEVGVLGQRWEHTQDLSESDRRTTESTDSYSDETDDTQ